MKYKAIKAATYQHSKMIKMFLLLFFVLLTVSFQTDRASTPSFIVTNSDSVTIKVYNANNSESSYFYSHLKAPVCEDGLCYDVELIVYWNLIGSFERFELVPQKPLTKLKHEPFTEAEYVKLAQLLANNKPTLSNYKKEELTTKIQNIDGVSGATVKAVKEETIAGAVYSCFTLWHLIHGEVVDSIQNVTAKNLTEKNIRQILKYQTENADLFLLKHLSEKQFNLFCTELLPISINRNWFFSKMFFESIPNSFVARPEFQTFIAANYHKIEYIGQVSLLKRLQSQHISSQLASSLLNNAKGNSTTTEMIFQLIHYNMNQLNDSVLKQMVETITNQSLRINTEIATQLLADLKNKRDLQQEYKSLKKHFSQFK